MNLRIELASIEEKPLLRQGLDDCLAELSRYGDVDAAYPYFDAYWDIEERRWPYLIRREQETVGFALVNTWSPSGTGTDFAMAEFFIVPNARGAGNGCEAAKEVFRRHPGQWELGIMALNAPAKSFWPKTIKAAQASVVERMEADGETIYRFKIK